MRLSFRVCCCRVGRTGRAGNKGTAITFIGPDEDRYAPDLVKALKESSATVPQDLQELAEVFASKKKQGLVQGHGSGYGGSGFKFDKAEDAKIKQARKSKAKVGMDPVCSFFLGQSVQHSTHRMFHKLGHFWGQKSLTGIWHMAHSRVGVEWWALG